MQAAAKLNAMKAEAASPDAGRLLAQPESSLDSMGRTVLSCWLLCTLNPLLRWREQLQQALLGPARVGSVRHSMCDCVCVTRGHLIHLIRRPLLQQAIKVLQHGGPGFCVCTCQHLAFIKEELWLPVVICKQDGGLCLCSAGGYCCRRPVHERCRLALLDGAATGTLCGSWTARRHSVSEEQLPSQLDSM